MSFSNVLCIGGAVVDRVGETADAGERLHTSNIGTMRTSIGGVARNVAENLARLGILVRLTTRVGDDADGASVIAATRKVGVDTGFAQIDRERRTASYTAIINGTGELVIGLADMEIFSAITPHVARNAIAVAGNDALVFADANLPVATLEAIVAAKPAALAVGPVSQQKSLRLRSILGEIDYLFINRYEAAAILDKALLPADELLPHLGASPARRGLLTTGADGAVLWEGSAFVPIAAAPSKPINVNGAGDAFAAATLARMVRGDDFETAARIAMAAAAMTVECATTVCDTLSMDAIMARHRERARA